MQLWRPSGPFFGNVVQNTIGFTVFWRFPGYLGRKKKNVTRRVILLCTFTNIAYAKVAYPVYE